MTSPKTKLAPKPKQDNRTTEVVSVSLLKNTLAQARKKAKARGFTHSLSAYMGFLITRDQPEVAKAV